ncbi:MAG TPA: transporter [Verrucomicrobiota bacterium]|nr:transporter [Verrucomicrobiota bacterium]HNU51325.1 transporter [Verrucomicrobiota bacterium]
MKRATLRWMRIGAGTLAALCAGTALGQSFSGHYPIGVEGLKAGSLPPPGVYLRDYNVYYFADRLNDANGDKVPGDLDLSAYANAIRPIWITDWKLLGGSYGMDVLVPIIYTDFSINGMGDSSFGVGDLFVEPITLSWHWKQADLGVGYGFWAPTGNSSLRSPAKPGKGYWGHMLTLGGTWYPDAAKTWSVSVLGRYEINMEHEDIDIRPGDELSIEGGIGKSLSKSVEVGVVGYMQRQVTGDSGRTPTPHDRVFGVGPEVNLFCPKLATFFSIRYLYEFGAEDRPEGNTVTVTLTRRF